MLVMGHRQVGQPEAEYEGNIGRAEKTTEGLSGKAEKLAAQRKAEKQFRQNEVLQVPSS